MKVSLIATTFDRPVELRRLLVSLVSQDVGIELVLIDQSSARTYEENTAGIRELGLRVTHLRTGRLSVSAARNCGLEFATGDVVSFPDDDCWYENGLLRRVCETLMGHRADLISTRYGEPGIRNVASRTSACRLTPDKLFGRASSVTLFVRRSLILESKARFDERLGVGTSRAAGEEMDFVLRLMRRPIVALYEPSIVVYHAVERESTMGRSARMKRDRATTYVRLMHARHYWLLVRTVCRYAKTAVRALWSKDARDSLAAQSLAVFDLIAGS